MSAIRSVLGPRIPAMEWASHRGRYLLPTVLLIIAAVVLAGSILLPYWHMALHAPQYPHGLHVTAYLNRLTGDVEEIDHLNHYIGMRPLNDAAKYERSTSIMAVAVLALLVLAAVRIRSPWAALLALPVILFPLGFLLDLHLWMAYFGQNLDPHAPLSHAIKPFVPPVLGKGFVGQFRTVALPGAGLILASAASVITVVALVFHRAAYKPLTDAAKERRS